MAQLQKIFVYGLGQIPSVFQELLHSQDFYSHHRLTLNFEPVTFSRGRSHHTQHIWRGQARTLQTNTWQGPSQVSSLWMQPTADYEPYHQHMSINNI